MTKCMIVILNDYNSNHYSPSISKIRFMIDVNRVPLIRQFSDQTGGQRKMHTCNNAVLLYSDLLTANRQDILFSYARFF